MRALIASASGVLASAVLFAAAAGAKPAKAPCPLKPGATPTGGDVQWAFSETGAPSGKHHGIKTSYTHGRGNWTSGRGAGKVCSQDSLSSGHLRNLVLAVTGGRSKLSPKVAQSGRLGVRLVLPIRVSSSDDSTCATGARGTATLFASYYSVHRDSLSLHFAAACSDHDHQFSGSGLHVLITRHGAQVNTP